MRIRRISGWFQQATRSVEPIADTAIEEVIPERHLLPGTLSVELERRLDTTALSWLHR